MTALAFDQIVSSAASPPARADGLRSRPGEPRRGEGSKRPRSGWFLFVAWSFVLLVALPGLGTVFYLALIASDEYVVETRFAVRASAEKRATADLGMGGSNVTRAAMAGFLEVGGGSASPGNDAYVLASFVRSGAIAAEFDREGRLRTMFGSPKVDWLSRFDPADSAERLASYWSTKVKVSVDRLSRIVTLRVSTFEPEDAVRLARDVIARCEAVVNGLAERRRRDSVRLAQGEVDQAQKRYMNALVALKEFRAVESTADHVQAIEAAARTLLEVEAEQIGLKAQRSALVQQTSAGASTVGPLDARIAALETQLNGLREQMASERAQVRSVASAVTRLQAFELERQFSQKIYEMTEASLVRAKEEADRQHEYLVVFVEPRAPEKPSLSVHASTVGFVLTVCLFAWGLLLLVAASIREQRV